MIARLNGLSAGVYAMVVTAAICSAHFPRQRRTRFRCGSTGSIADITPSGTTVSTSGIFQKAGIDLEVLEGKGSAVTAQTVGNGSVMFGTADAAAVMGFISQGMPIKIVGGYLRQSALAIIFPAERAGRNSRIWATPRSAIRRAAPPPKFSRR